MNRGIFEAFGQNRRINRGRAVTINGLTGEWRGQARCAVILCDNRIGCVKLIG